VTITGTSAQLAAGAAMAGNTPAPLTAGQLGPVVAAAEQQWAAAGANPARLSAARFLITTQLPFGEIGYTDGNTIYLDPTAAGFGWYTGVSGAFDANGVALAGGPAAGHMDLLTVVLHEIGHIVGLPDGCACGPYSELMQATLPAGLRRSLPAVSSTPALRLSPPPPGPAGAAVVSSGDSSNEVIAVSSGGLGMVTAGGSTRSAARGSRAPWRRRRLTGRRRSPASLQRRPALPRLRAAAEILPRSVRL
jgi:hypothetical protein